MVLGRIVQVCFFLESAGADLQACWRSLRTEQLLSGACVTPSAPSAFLPLLCVLLLGYLSALTIVWKLPEQRLSQHCNILRTWVLLTWQGFLRTLSVPE